MRSSALCVRKCGRPSEHEAGMDGTLGAVLPQRVLAEVGSRTYGRRPLYGSYQPMLHGLPPALPSRPCRDLRSGQPLRLHPHPSCAACPGRTGLRSALHPVLRLGCRSTLSVREEMWTRGGRRQGMLGVPGGMSQSHQGQKWRWRVIARAAPLGSDERDGHAEAEGCI